jgi:hypothetical protein
VDAGGEPERIFIIEFTADRSWGYRILPDATRWPIGGMCGQICQQHGSADCQAAAQSKASAGGHRGS